MRAGEFLNQADQITGIKGVKPVEWLNKVLDITGYGDSKLGFSTTSKLKKCN